MSLIREDKVKSTGHIANVVFTEDVANGSLLVLGALKADKESYDGAKVAVLATDRPVLISSVPMNYEAGKTEEDFTNKAGKRMRGRILEVGDIYTITNDMLVGTPVVGKYVVGTVGDVKGTVADAVTTQKVVFKIIDLDTLNGAAASVLEVVNA